MQQPNPLFTRVPHELDTWSYDRVRERMVTTRAELPSALAHITDDFSHSLGTFHEHNYDTSFSRQMHELVEHEPQLIVCTLKSAAPVAAAVRNFYHYIHQPTPHIGGIQANQQAASDYYDLPFLKHKDPRSEHKQQTEVARLTEQRIRLGLTRVAIVDQFVASGRTMSYAAALLRISGFTQIHGVQGRWYEDSNEPVGRSAQHITTRHAGFMKCIGRTAAKTTI